MPAIVGGIVNISTSVNYTISPDHRPGANLGKSIWAIIPDDEVECFRLCFVNNWIASKKGWSLISEGKGNFRLLGYSSKHDELFLAKFVGDTTWHGYPANIRENIHDRPAHPILMDWLAKQLLHKYQVSRIKQGKI